MAARTQQSQPAPIVVVYGDDDHQKTVALDAALDALLPPDVDRSLALTSYDASRSGEQGGPTLAAVIEDLSTLPFLTERRVVVVRAADPFVTAHRERLEAYLGRPSPTGTLIIECRTFPRTTRLYKLATAAGGTVVECKKLSLRAAADFVLAEVRGRGKQMAPDAAAWLVSLIGPDSGALVNEVEKLVLYTGEAKQIDPAAIADLVGQTREEKIFEVMDVAASGRLGEAQRLWQQVLATDPDAIYKVIGGMAFKARQWLAAQQMRAEGASISEIAPRIGLWGRPREAEALLTRLTAARIRRMLAALAELDSQAKAGLRSIDTGVEIILLRLAASAA